MEVLETTLNRIPYNAYTDKTVFSCGDFANLLRRFLFFLTRFVAESLPPSPLIILLKLSSDEIPSS